MLLPVCWLLTQFEASAAGPALSLLTNYPLPGVKGRLGHLALDSSRRLLYVPACDGGSVEVLDLSTGRRVRQMQVDTPRRLVVLSRPNLLYVTCGRDGQVKVLDCAAGRAIKTIGPLPQADALWLDAPANRVYVGYDSALAMLNAQTGVHTVTTPLAGHPAAIVIEPTGQRLFVNVPAAGHVAVIERLTREVVATWALPPEEAGEALALDGAHGRLFVACNRPAQLTVLDTASGKPVATVPVAGDIGTLCYDATRRRLYGLSGEGVVEVLEQTDPDHYAPQVRLATARGARTGLFDGESGRLFVAVPAVGGRAAEVRVYAAGP